MIFHPSDLIQNIGLKDLAGIKITFINMPLRESALPNTPPEGPAILSAIIRKYGAIPSIIDLNAYRIKDNISKEKFLSNGRHLTEKEVKSLLEKHIQNVGDQDIIALSGKITTLKWQEEVATIARELQPESFIVSGNGLATEINSGLFQWIPELDAIARSEGDDVIVLICKDAMVIKKFGINKAFKSGKLSPYYVGEINERHRFIYEGNRPKHLDNIPYAALDLLESDPYGHNILEDYIKVPVWGLKANNSSATPFEMKRSLTTVSSRGCPYACTFCYRGAQGERNYGMRSAINIAKQIKEYVDRYNLDFIGFPDDNFAVDRRRIDEMVSVFKEYGIDHIRWGTHTRMDEGDERVFQMAKSGCVYIGFGAESADEKIIKLMNKGGFILKNGVTKKRVNGNVYNFPTTMVNAINNCNTAGIHANCTWIMGYPGEGLDELKTSVAFILWQKDYLGNGLISNSNNYERLHQSVNKKMFTATAYPGTKLWDILKPDLKKHFNINFDSVGDPVCDDNFHDYVLELDDATKILTNNKGDPVYFGDMHLDKFLLARDYVNNNEIEKIFDLI